MFCGMNALMHSLVLGLYNILYLECLHSYLLYDRHEDIRIAITENFGGGGRLA